MTDIWGGLTEGIGKLAEPLDPALEFLGLGTQEPKAADLFGAIGRGLKNAALNSPAGIAYGATQLFDDDLSARDRFLFGALLGVGAVAGGREAYRRWHAGRLANEAVQATIPRPRPVQHVRLEELGEKPKLYPHDLTPEEAIARTSFPGARGRQLRLLGARHDTVKLGEEIASFDVDPLGDPGVSRIAARLERYAQASTDSTDAAFDFALADRVVELGVLKGDAGTRFKELYAKFTSGTRLTEEEWGAVEGGVRQLSEVLQHFNYDGTFKYLGRISSIEAAVDSPPVVTVEYARPLAGDIYGDEAHRAQMLKALNPGYHFDVGLRNLRFLLRRGLAEEAAGREIIPGGKGSNWYRHYNGEILAEARKRGFKDDSKLFAVVALSSAEQDWATNIPKAVALYGYVARNADALSDDDFQSWLKAFNRRKSGAEKSLHAQRFREIRAAIGQDWGGGALKDDDLAKVLRLATESVDELFASTGATKQKNFYLNLFDPEGDHSVTIDRHAFDAYWGVDSGVQDRPIADSLAYGTGETSYDVLADAYRYLPQEPEFANLLPHQIQSVVWEAWKAYKGPRTPGKGYAGRSWKNRNPIRLPDLDDDGAEIGENRAFLELTGKGESLPGDLRGRPGETFPVAVFDDDAAGDGYSVYVAAADVGHVASVDQVSDRTHRNLFPFAITPGGRAVHSMVAPLKVNDAKFVDRLAQADPTAPIELISKEAGTHPALEPGVWVEWDEVGPDPRQLPYEVKQQLASGGDRGLRIERSAPAYDLSTRSAADFRDQHRAKDILGRGQWAAIPGTPGELAEIAGKLREQGYFPFLSVDGKYLIASGVTGAEAVKAAPGRSIFTPQGVVSDDPAKQVAVPGDLGPVRAELDELGLTEVEPMVASDFSNPETPRTRGVGPEEYAALAARGKARLAELQTDPATPAALAGQRWADVKDAGWESVQEEWGGITADTHTGKLVDAGGGDRYALTVRPPGTETVTVPIGASRRQFDAAMEKARKTWSVGDRTLWTRQAHIGVFRNEDIGVIEFDPVLVVDNLDDVETIGVFTRAHGGAYNFADGDGYWPPHLVPEPLGDVMVPLMDGSAYPLDIERVNVPGTTEMARNPQKVQRLRYRVRDHARSNLSVGQIAEGIERAGRQNVRIFATDVDLGEGWMAARMHTFDSGSAYHQVLTAENVVGASNSVPVFVRPSQHLSKTDPFVPSEGIVPSRFDGDAVVDGKGVRTYSIVPDSTFEAAPAGGTLLGGDINDRIREFQQARAMYGDDKVRATLEGGKQVKLWTPPKKGISPGRVSRVTVAQSIPRATRQPRASDPMVGPIRILSWLPDDSPLSTGLVREITGAVEVGHGELPEVAELWGVHWVSADKAMHGRVGDSNTYYAAVSRGEPGTGIHLNADWWSREDDLREALAWDAGSGWHGGRGDPFSVVVHEYGHLLHYVVELLQSPAGRIPDKYSMLNPRALPPVVRQALDLYETHIGPYAQRGQLRGQLPKNPSMSRYARTNWMEMYAEAVADVLTGANRFPASKIIFDALYGHLREALPKAKIWWGFSA